MPKLRTEILNFEESKEIYDRDIVRLIELLNKHKIHNNLDMIFINSEKEVVGIIKNTTILSEKTLSINKPSKYIIEVNAGVADKYGLAVGTNVNGEF